MPTRLKNISHIATYFAYSHTLCENFPGFVETIRTLPYFLLDTQQLMYPIVYQYFPYFPHGYVKKIALRFSSIFNASHPTIKFKVDTSF